MSQSQPTPTLIFIPDISGFTEFVHTTEVSHSQHIVRELLEKIIDSNSMGLVVSEIEGDAVLFYRMGEAPSAKELLSQVREMYIQFHAHLKLYEQQRICQCGACISAHQLKLKFVAHYGILTTSQVKTFDKLFGADLIVAHRLLKNRIPMDEYLLVTRSLEESGTEWDRSDDLKWASIERADETYDFGDIQFLYMPMSPLLPDVPEPQLGDYGIRNAETEMLRASHVFQAPLEMVVDVLSDMSFRHKWQPIKDSTDVKYAISQTGNAHRCVIDGGSRDPYQISHSFETIPNTVTWTETDTVNKVNNVIRVERLGIGETRVTLALYANPNFALRLAFALVIKKRVRGQLEKGFTALEIYLSELVKEGREHPNGLVLNV